MAIQSTVKTHICSFTENRLYPGRGTRRAARDGKVYIYSTRRVSALAQTKRKPLQLRWTSTWRRAHKKGREEAVTRRRHRKTVKVNKAIVGLTLEEFQKKKSLKRDPKTSEAHMAAIKEAKAKNQKSKAAAVSGKPAPSDKQIAPKNQMRGKR